MRKNIEKLIWEAERENWVKVLEFVKVAFQVLGIIIIIWGFLFLLGIMQ